MALIASRDDAALYDVESGAKRIAAVDLSKGKVVKSYSLPQEPSGMTLAGDGKLLFGTVGGSEGEVVLIDLKSGKTVGSIAAGYTPMAPVQYPHRPRPVDYAREKQIASN